MKKEYSEEYDAYYDSETNEWLEEICEDPECEYCSNRPDRFPAPEKNFESLNPAPENKKLEKRV